MKSILKFLCKKSSIKFNSGSYGVETIQRGYEVEKIFKIMSPYIYIWNIFIIEAHDYTTFSIF